MKKENRRLAQQRRAEERKKMEQQRKVKKFLTYFLPSVCVLVLAGVLIWDGVRQSAEAEASAQESASDTSDAADGSAADTAEDTAEDTAGNTADGSTDTQDTASQNTDTANTAESSGYSTDPTLTLQDGDSVNIDYVGSIDGVEFEGGSTGGTGTTLVIGSGYYIDDFEEQLIGSHPGDTVDVNVTFPEDYGKEELNGKDALFQVTINGIYEN